MRAVAILMLFWAGAALADQNGAFQDGKSLGSSVNQSAFSGINSGAASDKIPSYGTNPSETQFFQGGQGQLSGPGVAKMQNCATATPDSDPIKRQECEAVNFLARNPQVRPQLTITRNDPMMLAAEYARDNAEDIMAQFGMNQQGSQSQCTTRTDTTPAVYETATCSVAREFVANQCVYGREVVIDADANYQCDQTVNAYETLKCRRSSSVTCTGGGDGCDQGGIVPNSWAGDMVTSWFPDGAGNYILQFGTIADNYWRGYGAIYDRTLTFDIRDVDLITKFVLTRADFDDWLLVKVNGTVVYVGPYGGDRLEVTTYQSCMPDLGCIDFAQVQYCATCFGWAELETSWHFALNIDLKPYLRDGSNTIFTRTVVGGYGESAIQITTRQRCPLNCSVSTNNQCAALEARAQ